MSIQSTITSLHAQLPDNVELVAVSKFHSSESIRQAYSAGQRIFGESRVQELVAKQGELPNDIEWRMIGHLQCNKVKYIAPFISLIESVDSQRLIVEINRCALKVGRVIDILLEIHVAQEQSKDGWEWSELKEFIASDQIKEMKGIRLRGVMGMATYTDNQKRIRGDFNLLHEYFCELKPLFGESFDTLSMGMSDDYQAAIECGSTSVRIGSMIFGGRI